MIDLNTKYISILKQIFDTYCQNAEIWAYGSRVNGDCHNGSDLDPVVVSYNEHGKNLSELKQLIRDSDIPILVDISEFNTLPTSFQNEIRKNKIIFYGNPT